MKKLSCKILLIVNIIFAAALIISYLAVLIDPALFSIPALFGLAYPYLLLVNLVIILIWLVALRPEAIISIIIIVIGYTHLSNNIKLSKPSGDKTGAIKVMSYNVHLFNNYEGKKPVSSESKITGFIRNEQPDLICLQEFFFKGNVSQKEQLFRRAAGNGYHSHIKMIESGKNSYFGIITLSKFPIVRKGDIVHPGSAGLSIFTDVVSGRDTIRIYNNHLQSFRLQRMETNFLSEITDGSDSKGTLSEIRMISSSLRKGFAIRAGQARSVKEHINQSPYPVIVAGDFNDTPVSYSYSKLRKGLHDSFVESGYGAGFTYRGNYPANRIDYILYDDHFDCTQFDIVRVKYSDHYPVISYLRRGN